MRRIHRTLRRALALALVLCLGAAGLAQAQITVPPGFALDSVTTTAGAITRVAIAPAGFGAFEGSSRRRPASTRPPRSCGGR